MRMRKARLKSCYRGENVRTMKWDGDVGSRNSVLNALHDCGNVVWQFGNSVVNVFPEQLFPSLLITPSSEPTMAINKGDTLLFSQQEGAFVGAMSDAEMEGLVAQGDTWTTVFELNGDESVLAVLKETGQKGLEAILKAHTTAFDGEYSMLYGYLVDVPQGWVFTEREVFLAMNELQMDRMETAV